jgi:hypothetical protein
MIFVTLEMAVRVCSSISYLKISRILPMSEGRSVRTSLTLEYTASASKPSSPSWSWSFMCLLTQIYPFKPRMRSTPQGSARKCDFKRCTRMGGTVTICPLRS